MIHILEILTGKLQKQISNMTNGRNRISNPVFVLADIGGTNARFALYTPRSDGDIQLREPRQFRCRQFNDFSEALSTYLDQTGLDQTGLDQTGPDHEGHPVRGASVSIAAPADGDLIRMTNLDWTFSISEVKKAFNFQHMWVINDATAACLATTRAAQLELIRPGHAESGATRINLIPGTGFGIGSIMPFENGWLPIQGEGGHATLAAVSSEEFAVLQHITRQHGRATNDRVLSGPGMLRIYQALAEVRGQQAADVDAQEMTRNALQNNDSTSVDALDMYCTLLGRLAGDLALIISAHGGVYLSGDLLQRIGAERIAEHFNSGFNDKGKMTDKVSRIPVYLLHSEYPCLQGAAVWLDSQLALLHHIA